MLSNFSEHGNFVNFNTTTLLILHFFYKKNFIIRTRGSFLLKI